MQKFLKYLVWICLGGIAMTLTFCSVGVYQILQTFNRMAAGADNYTCRQFLYDIDAKHLETDKMPAIIIATAAYGTGKEGDRKRHQEEFWEEGMEPAVRKVYALCKGNPSQRVVNLFTAGITGATNVSSTTPNNTTNTISVTTPVSPTLNTEH